MTKNMKIYEFLFLNHIESTKICLDVCKKNFYETCQSDFYIKVKNNYLMKFNSSLEILNISMFPNKA